MNRVDHILHAFSPTQIDILIELLKKENMIQTCFRTDFIENRHQMEERYYSLELLQKARQSYNNQIP